MGTGHRGGRAGRASPVVGAPGAAGPLSPADLLDLWEDGARHEPLERALGVLARAGGPADRAVLAGLSIGQRDALLMAVREQTFGSRVDGSTACPACACLVEVGIDLGALRRRQPWPFAPGPVRATASRGEWTLGLHAPTTSDLLAVAAGGEDPPRPERLLDRCIEWAKCAGRPTQPGDVPASVRAAAEDRLLEVDPLAVVEVDLVCPHCRHAWRTLFDIARFLWTEIGAAAARLRREVHALARAYGWSEPAILALSPARRRAYLEMAEA